MWQRFTERARRVVFFSQEEAGKLGESYVSTEHLLLGMVHERDTVAARLLETMGLSLERVRSELEQQVRSSGTRPSQDMQLTPRAKRVIDLSYDEARKLDNNYIGTEHLLLGLIREEDGLAGRVLIKLGATLRRAREEIMLLQESSIREKAGNDLLTGEARATWVASAYEYVYGQAEAEGTVGVPFKEVAEKAISSFARVRYALKFLRRAEPDLFRTEVQSSLEKRVTAVLERTVDPAPGDLGNALASRPNGMVEIALDTETFQALVAAYRAKDVHGYRQLTHDNQSLILVPDGTPLKMLITPEAEAVIVEVITKNSMYVRVLVGTYEGYAGWMFADAFRHEGPDQAPFPPLDTVEDAHTTPPTDSDKAS